MLIPSDTCMDTVSIIAPAMAFPINIPRSDSTTLILKIDAKAAPDHEPVVGKRYSHKNY